MARLIVLDDEPRLLKTVRRFLEHAGHDVRTAACLADASDWIQPGEFDVLITDIFMPGCSGIEVLRQAVERGCSEPVILITGEPHVSTAGDAVRHGAFDYVPKPLTKDKLLRIVARALQHVTLIRERDRARENELQLLRGFAAIGESASILAHEIRTPLTNLNAALRAVGDQLGIKHQEVLQELVGPLERMQAMMKRTLSFAKPLQLCRSSQDVGDLLDGARNCIGCNGDLAVEIDVAADVPAIDVDQGLLEEVLVNLLHNAHEACEHGGRVRMHAETRADGGVNIYVDDNGPGIDEHQRKRLFQLFHTTKKNGTGIGLAFCRKVIDTHGGSLELVPSELGGTNFRIALTQHNGAESHE